MKASAFADVRATSVGNALDLLAMHLAMNGEKAKIRRSNMLDVATAILQSRPAEPDIADSVVGTASNGTPPISFGPGTLPPGIHEAAANTVNDALRPCGTIVTEIPLTPQ
ncbi:MAG: hypothetical protein WCB02_07075, partial [Bradyrhizobium sp.]